ncbi:Hypothetical_protein [Hexamita inflata]|uniref:Hypothetical_protein n=1 Tax=Hexamita inflata TaxID=28002 RepID=A0AA86NTP3_9EUKA|nr:Hypothetical protein HINF_LOCUS12966 [Hexamita inflata]
MFDIKTNSISLNELVIQNSIATQEKRQQVLNLESMNYEDIKSLYRVFSKDIKSQNGHYQLILTDDKQIDIKTINKNEYSYQLEPPTTQFLSNDLIMYDNNIFRNNLHLIKLDSPIISFSQCGSFIYVLTQYVLYVFDNFVCKLKLPAALISNPTSIQCVSEKEILLACQNQIYSAVFGQGYSFESLTGISLKSFSLCFDLEFALYIVGFKLYQFDQSTQERYISCSDEFHSDRWILTLQYLDSKAVSQVATFNYLASGIDKTLQLISSSQSLQNKYVINSNVIIYKSYLSIQIQQNKIRTDLKVLEVMRQYRYNHKFSRKQHILSKTLHQFKGKMETFTYNNETVHLISYVESEFGKSIEITKNKKVLISSENKLFRDAERVLNDTEADLIIPFVKLHKDYDGQIKQTKIIHKSPVKFNQFQLSRSFYKNQQDYDIQKSQIEESINSLTESKYQMNLSQQGPIFINLIFDKTMKLIVTQLDVKQEVVVDIKSLNKLNRLFLQKIDKANQNYLTTPLYYQFNEMNITFILSFQINQSTNKSVNSIIFEQQQLKLVQLSSESVQYSEFYYKCPQEQLIQLLKSNDFQKLQNQFNYFIQNGYLTVQASDLQQDEDYVTIQDKLLCFLINLLFDNNQEYFMDLDIAKYLCEKELSLLVFQGLRQQQVNLYCKYYKQIIQILNLVLGKLSKHEEFYICCTVGDEFLISLNFLFRAFEISKLSSTEFEKILGDIPLLSIEEHQSKYKSDLQLLSCLYHRFDNCKFIPNIMISQCDYLSIKSFTLPSITEYLGAIQLSKQLIKDFPPQFIIDFSRAYQQIFYKTVNQNPITSEEKFVQVLNNNQNSDIQTNIYKQFCKINKITQLYNVDVISNSFFKIFELYGLKIVEHEHLIQLYVQILTEITIQKPQIYFEFQDFMLQKKYSFDQYKQLSAFQQIEESTHFNLQSLTQISDGLFQRVNPKELVKKFCQLSQQSQDWQSLIQQLIFVVQKQDGQKQAELCQYILQNIPTHYSEQDEQFYIFLSEKVDKKWQECLVLVFQFLKFQTPVSPNLILSMEHESSSCASELAQCFITQQQTPAQFSEFCQSFQNNIFIQKVIEKTRMLALVNQREDFIQHFYMTQYYELVIDSFELFTKQELSQKIMKQLMQNALLDDKMVGIVFRAYLNYQEFTYNKENAKINKLFFALYWNLENKEIENFVDAHDANYLKTIILQKLSVNDIIQDLLNQLYNSIKSDAYYEGKYSKFVNYADKLIKIIFQKQKQIQLQLLLRVIVQQINKQLVSPLEIDTLFTDDKTITYDRIFDYKIEELLMNTETSQLFTDILKQIVNKNQLIKFYLSLLNVSSVDYSIGPTIQESKYISYIPQYSQIQVQTILHQILDENEQIQIKQIEPEKHQKVIKQLQNGQVMYEQFYLQWYFEEFVMGNAALLTNFAVLLGNFQMTDNYNYIILKDSKLCKTIQHELIKYYYDTTNYTKAQNMSKNLLSKISDIDDTEFLSIIETINQPNIVLLCQQKKNQDFDHLKQQLMKEKEQVQLLMLSTDEDAIQYLNTSLMVNSKYNKNEIDSIQKVANFFNTNFKYQIISVFEFVENNAFDVSKYLTLQKQYIQDVQEINIVSFSDNLLQLCTFMSTDIQQQLVSSFMESVLLNQKLLDISPHIANLNITQSIIIDQTQSTTKLEQVEAKAQPVAKNSAWEDSESKEEIETETNNKVEEKVEEKSQVKKVGWDDDESEQSSEPSQKEKSEKNKGWDQDSDSEQQQQQESLHESQLTDLYYQMKPTTQIKLMGICESYNLNLDREVVIESVLSISAKIKLIKTYSLADFYRLVSLQLLQAFNYKDLDYFMKHIYQVREQSELCVSKQTFTKFSAQFQPSYNFDPVKSVLLDQFNVDSCFTRILVQSGVFNKIPLYIQDIHGIIQQEQLDYDLIKDVDLKIFKEFAAPDKLMLNQMKQQHFKTAQKFAEALQKPSELMLKIFLAEKKALIMQSTMKQGLIKSYYENKAENYEQSDIAVEVFKPDFSNYEQCALFFRCVSALGKEEQIVANLLINTNFEKVIAYSHISVYNNKFKTELEQLLQKLLQKFQFDETNTKLFIAPIGDLEQAVTMPTAALKGLNIIQLAEYKESIDLCTVNSLFVMNEQGEVTSIIELSGIQSGKLLEISKGREERGTASKLLHAAGKAFFGKK